MTFALWQGNPVDAINDEFFVIFIRHGIEFAVEKRGLVRLINQHHLTTLMIPPLAILRFHREAKKQTRYGRNITYQQHWVIATVLHCPIDGIDQGTMLGQHRIGEPFNIVLPTISAF